MPRVSLPGAAELFRSTEPPPTVPTRTSSPTPGETATDDPDGQQVGRTSGRIRHDEKITVYVSADELVALEQARLTLRARHGLAVDRGRIVREAIAALLADLDDRAADSELVRRLSAS